MVLVQSWEKGDEPLPAGFKGWQLGLPLGFAAPACSQPLLLLVALSTPHGSHLSLSLFSLKKKNARPDVDHFDPALFGFSPHTQSSLSPSPRVFISTWYVRRSSLWLLWLNNTNTTHRENDSTISRRRNHSFTCFLLFERKETLTAVVVVLYLFVSEWWWWWWWW